MNRAIATSSRNMADIRRRDWMRLFERQFFNVPAPAR
jgi:hypothetical protein